MILVTGATGFIGRHLVRRLIQEGEFVRCVVRPSSDISRLPTDNIQLVRPRLTDACALAAAVEGCSSVYHLAAQTSAVRRRELYRTNYLGCHQLAAACAQVATSSTAPTLVVVSSIAAAGTAIAGRLRNARDQPHPVSEYGRSKRAGEIAACQFADRLPVSIVRPGIVLGADSRELEPLFESIRRFRLHAVPGYTARRYAIIHVDDLVEILLRVAQSGRRIAAPPSMRTNGNGQQAIGGDGYYCAATDMPTYAGLGRMIGRALGTGMPLVLPVPELVAWLAAGGAQFGNYLRGSSESFNIDKMREAFAGDWIGATDNLWHDLHFKPRWSLESRLTQLARNLPSTRGTKKATTALPG